MVPEVGIEPTRDCSHGILSPFLSISHNFTKPHKTLDLSVSYLIFFLP